MTTILNSQAFGLMLAMAFYLLGGFLYRKTKLPLFNPLLMASLLLILYIKVAKINVNNFLTDISGISIFLGPLIVSLAIPVIKQLLLIKKNFLPIITGALVGSLTSIFSVKVMGKLFQLDKEIINSIIPKSVTTPIAIEISNRIGGIKAVTVTVVMITAVIGAIIGPIIYKYFNVLDPIEIGMSLGTTSHAVGTSKALEIEQTAGAISSIALVLAGILTTIISLFL